MIISGSQITLNGTVSKSKYDSTRPYYYWKQFLPSKAVGAYLSISIFNKDTVTPWDGTIDGTFTLIVNSDNATEGLHKVHLYQDNNNTDGDDGGSNLIGEYFFNVITGNNTVSFNI